jgi:hypothetical protein
VIDRQGLEDRERIDTIFHCSANVFINREKAPLELFEILHISCRLLAVTALMQCARNYAESFFKHGFNQSKIMRYYLICTVNNTLMS